MAGAKPVIINLKAENEFKLTAKEIEDACTDKTKILILPFPNNPTGSIMEKEELEKIAKVIIEKDLYVLSDEIYAELTYKGKHVSITTIEGMKERTILINGFSKSYAMTGWRLGYACAPQKILEQMLKIHQYAIMCAPTTSQYAAVEALKNGDKDVEEMRRSYNHRRRFLMKRRICDKISYGRKGSNRTWDCIRGQRRGIFENIIRIFVGNSKNRDAKTQ